MICRPIHARQRYLLALIVCAHKKMHLYQLIISKRTSEIRKEIRGQFYLVYGALIKTTLKKESLRILFEKGNAKLSADEAALDQASLRIALTITEEQKTRGIIEDIIYSLFRRSEIRRRNAKLFLHELLVNKILKISYTEDASVYPDDLNRAFAIIMAFAQFRGTGFSRAMQAKNLVLSEGILSETGAYQRYLLSKTPQSYDNIFTEKIANHLGKLQLDQ